MHQKPEGSPWPWPSSEKSFGLDTKKQMKKGGQRTITSFDKDYYSSLCEIKCALIFYRDIGLFSLLRLGKTL